MSKVVDSSTAGEALRTQFVPSGERGRLIDAEMQDDLLRSLLHIAQACSPSAISRYLAEPIERLRGGQALTPVAFGLYFHLGEALFGDLLDVAEAAALGLRQCSAREPGIQIVGRGDPSAQKIDQVLNWRMGEEAKLFVPVAEADEALFRDRFDQGMSLLAHGAPMVHSEICAFLSLVLLARSPPGGLLDFDGASHYQFWGLLMLNPQHHRSRLAVAEVLAHESGHSVLFGLSRESLLVLNPDEDLYDSPLRTDPRPMDGIFHATYVSARMALVMETLAASDCLTPEERDQALSAARVDRENFEKGLSVVQAHGRLTPSGRKILDGAIEWIRSSESPTVRRS